jgi:carboxymethylenebutenolidase
MPERQNEVIETEVDIRTQDGTCNAVFFHPAAGSHAGVLVWPDAFGVRASTREIGQRTAAAGYTVILPNPYYRVSRSPLPEASQFSFQDPADMAKLHALMAPLHAPGVIESDSAALAGFLDEQPEVDRSRKMGTQGYCMGGRFAVRTAAALPHRVGAAASFHGGGLVTDGPDSPHLLAPRIKARIYVGISEDDDNRQPEAKVVLRQAFVDAHVAAEVEVYPGAWHGWCIRDMPERDGKPVYSQPDAEHAWGKLVALYRATLG